MTAMRRFAGIELGDDRIPDETTILSFRHLLERHGLTEAIFADVNTTSGRQGHHVALGHDGRCDDHRCALFDQEQVQRTRY